MWCGECTLVWWSGQKFEAFWSSQINRTASLLFIFLVKWRGKEAKGQRRQNMDIISSSAYYIPGKDHLEGTKFFGFEEELNQVKTQPFRSHVWHKTDDGVSFFAKPSFGVLFTNYIKNFSSSFSANATRPLEARFSFFRQQAGTGLGAVSSLQICFLSSLI